VTEERRSILQLLAQGKITVDEAERLLRAIEEHGEASTASTPAGEEKCEPRFLLISVKKKGAWSDDAVDEARKAWGWPGFSGVGRDKEVNVRVPMSIVRSGMRLGAIIPGMAGRHARLRERGIDLDLSKLDPATFESMLGELGEMNIDIDSGRAQVKISCE